MTYSRRAEAKIGGGGGGVNICARPPWTAVSGAIGAATAGAVVLLTVPRAWTGLSSAIRIPPCRWVCPIHDTGGM